MSVYRCGKCGQSLPDANRSSCPHCGAVLLGVEREKKGASDIWTDLIKPGLFLLVWGGIAIAALIGGAAILDRWLTPADYGSFQPDPGQWVIETKNLEPAQSDAVRQAIADTPGVHPEKLIRVNPQGQYVSFSYEDRETHNGGTSEEVRNHILKQLETLGVTTGRSKTAAE